MVTTYRREMNHNFLIVQPDHPPGDSYETRMLSENHIRGLLRFHLTMADGEFFYQYDITSKQPISRLLDQKNLKANELRSLISEIAQILNQVEKYLLSESEIWLDPESVYMDPESFFVCLCLIPGETWDFPSSMTKLLQFLMGKVDHRDRQSVVLAYGLYHESLKENYGMDNLLGVLCAGAEDRCDENKQEEGIREEKTEINTEGTESSVERSDQERKKTPDTKWLFPVAVIIGGPLISWLWMGNDGPAAWWPMLLAVDMVSLLWPFFPLVMSKIRPEKTGGGGTPSAFQKKEHSYSWRMELEDAGGEPEIPYHRQTRADWREETNKKAAAVPEEVCTALLCGPGEGDQAPQRYLRSLEPGIENIPLPYFPFIIGKQAGIVDFALSRETVSRLHVRLDFKNGEYLVTDLNSTNGTKIKGELLETNGTSSLFPGDEIYIADVGFVFT